MKLHMKKLTTALFLLITVGLVASGCATADAQPATQPPTAEEATEGNQAAIGVRTERHVKVALLTARQMFEGVGGYQADQVTIVVCGKGVQSLTKEAGLASELQRTQEKGDVRMVACGLTVERMNIDPDTFISGVEVVPNGFIELARLQALGYESVEL